MSDFISVRWPLDLGWRGAQWDGGLTGRSQSVSQTCLVLVSLATQHTQSWSLLQLPPYPFSPHFCPTGLSGALLLYSSAFLLSIPGSPINPLNPCSALHSDISLLHSCKFLQTNWTAHADSLLTSGSPALWCPEWCHMSLPKCYLHNVVHSQK